MRKKIPFFLMILFFDYMPLIFNKNHQILMRLEKENFIKKTATIQIERIEHFDS